MWHDSFLCNMAHSYVTWLIHMWHDSFICDMTHSYVTCLIHMWHASFICDMTHSYVTWLIHMWHASFIYGTTHSFQHGGLPLYVTWRIHIWHASLVYGYDWFIHGMTLSYMVRLIGINMVVCLYTWHDAFIYDMSHSCMIWLIHTWHDAIIYGTTHSYWHGRLSSYVTWRIHMRYDSVFSTWKLLPYVLLHSPAFDVCVWVCECACICACV